MAGPRGSIKIGTGYILIEPSIDQEALGRLRAKFTESMAKAGVQAGRLMGAGIMQGLAGLQREISAEAAKVQQTLTAASARGSRERQKVQENEQQRLARVEQEITRTHGAQVAKRSRDALEASEAQTRGLSRDAKLALRAHQESLEGMARADRELAAQQDRTAQRRAKALLRSYHEDLAEYRRAEAEKVKAAEGSAETQVQATRRAEAEKRRLLEDSARMDREIHREQDRQQREREAYERDYYAAHRENERRKRAEILETARLERQAQAEAQRMGALRVQAERLMAREIALAAQQALRESIAAFRAAAQARKAELREQLADAQVQRRTLQQQIGEYRRSLTTMDTTAASFMKRLNAGFDKATGKLTTFGTHAQETGRAVTHSLIAPLGVLAAALTAVGVKSADSMMQAQTGLRGMGMEVQDVTGMLKEMQKYAIATPYSLQDMQKYGTRFARAIGSHDGDFRSNDPERRKKGSARVSKKSGDVVKMIGDSAAYGGIMDPNLVSQGMYAMEVMMDMGRVPMRNMKQFERAIGMPAEDLALMLGFHDGTGEKGERKDASAFMYEFMQNAKETGGVQGTVLVDALLKRWGDKSNGIQGSAARMSGATISGRIGQMKESAQVGLQSLFMKEGKDGRFEYTGLGTKIMGRKVAARDDNGKVVKDHNGDVVYDYQGGLLNDVKGIGKKKILPLAEELLSEFLDVLKELTSWGKGAVSFLNAHPGWRDAFLKLAKFAALAAPFLIGFGLLAKLTGKLLKLMSPALTVGRGIVAAGTGANRIRQQVKAGREARASGGSYREAYRAQRAELRGGDDRSVGRRAWDKIRGTDSRENAVRVNTSQAEQALRELDQKIQDLQRQLREVNNISLHPTADGLSGPAGTGQNVAAAAQDAKQKIEAVSNAVRDLNAKSSTGTVRQEFTFLSQRAETSEARVKGVGSAMDTLNGKPLKALRQEFEETVPKVNGLRSAVQEVIERLRVLNQQSLKTLRNNLKGGGNSLYSATAAVADKLSTINSKIDSLAKKRVSGTTSSVNSLRTALKNAADEGERLNTHVGNVNRITGGGGDDDEKKGKGGRGRTKKALGGVIPGYAPGVDDVPALLSRGEAILRPEVTAHLGVGTINAWNAAAARGHLSRFARGGIAGRRGSGGRDWPFSILDELQNGIDFSPVLNTFTSGIGMSRAGDRIGGETGTNVRHWGARVGGDASGRAANNRVENLRGFMFNRLPEFLRVTPTGVGQLLGIAAGAVAPTAGQLFWDDVWQGEGNILQRGTKFTKDLLSPSKLFEMIKDLFGGIANMVKGLGTLAKDLITDPKKVLDESIATLKDLFEGEIETVKGVFDAYKQITGNPGEYAREVWDAFYARARESMPNTEGLFKFAQGGVVPGYSPGNDRVPSLLAPGEGVLTPAALRALGHSALIGLNRAADSGILPPRSRGQGSQQVHVVTSLPDAAAVEDAAGRITSALEEMTAAVQAHQAASAAAWTAIGSLVRDTVDGQIIPAQGRWAQYLAGPLAGAERTLASTHQGVWRGVQDQVSASTTANLAEFGRLAAGLDGLRRFFEVTAASIQSVWRTAMGYVDDSTRSTIAGPYNAGSVPMLAEMAKLAGAEAPLHPVRFSTGGVVPGYAPGVDDVPALLTRGEGIVRPEVVRWLGEDTIYRWNDLARKGGNLYARGGIVGDGGAWVRQHQDDDYKGYEEAIGKGWAAVIAPSLKNIAADFGVAGGINASAFEKARPWVTAWGKWVDEHTGGGGGAVSQLALQEAKSGDLSGAKYIGSAEYEAWCADFVSWIVDHAQSTASYGGSPTGTPGNRWPAVATWVEHMGMVPTSQARPGDLMVYRGYGPGDWGHINIVTGRQGDQLETVGGNESRSLRRQLGYGNRADGALRPRGAAPGTGGPILNPWPGSLARLSEGVGEYAAGQGGPVARWRQLVEQVIRELGGRGGISLSDVGLVLHRIDVESGGNPQAVNNWDSNAAAGDPSKGLMQVIGSTFAAYAGPYRSRGQYDPYASVYAGLSYAIDRYGSGWRRALGGTSGYWTGTKSATAGLAMVGEHGPELVNFRGGERVYNDRDTERLMSGRRYEIHVHEAKAENTSDAVLRALRTAEVMAGY
ncbi:CHAP domain-containing protein [Streptomyces sp. NPDC020379]|uniref:CHAP domain-containing protein n=1 Tax=Streptomyces sp. NPDC020379 TaxID=3365071 RepID=UPI0037A96709